MVTRTRAKTTPRTLLEWDAIEEFVAHDSILHRCGAITCAFHHIEACLERFGTATKGKLQMALANAVGEGVISSEEQGKLAKLITLRNDLIHGLKDYSLEEAKSAVSMFRHFANMIISGEFRQRLAQVSSKSDIPDQPPRLRSDAILLTATCIGYHLPEPSLLAPETLFICYEGIWGSKGAQLDRLIFIGRAALFATEYRRIESSIGPQRHLIVALIRQEPEMRRLEAALVAHHKPRLNKIGATPYHYGPTSVELNGEIGQLAASFSIPATCGIEDSPQIGTHSMRVYAFAKELALEPRDLLSKIRSLGIEAKNHMSSIEPEDIRRVHRARALELKEKEVKERLSGTVLRRRSRA